MKRLLDTMFGPYPTYGVIYINSADYPKIKAHVDTRVKPVNLPGFKGRIIDPDIGWLNDVNKETRIVCIDDTIDPGYVRIKMDNGQVLKLQL
jgi:hypothetical protein